MNTNTFKPVFFLIGFILLVGIACGPTKVLDPTATNVPVVVEQPTQPVIQPPTQQPTQTPTQPIIVTPTNPPAQPPKATETEVVEPEAFYVEEFEGDLNNWSYFLMNGDESNMDFYTEDGYLVFDLQGENQWVYVLYDEYTYTDVRIDVLADNRGKNTNNVSLICQYTDRDGWYEFNISNGGVYDIYVYSELHDEYRSLFHGGSKNVRMGRDINIYTAICQGKKLSLYINGILEREIVDNVYKLREGQVGVSVSSFEILPILVEIDYMAISQP